MLNDISERALILAPQGRDAFVAAKILTEARVVAEICRDLPTLLRQLVLWRRRRRDNRRDDPHSKIPGAWRTGSARNRRGRIFLSSL